MIGECGQRFLNLGIRINKNIGITCFSKHMFSLYSCLLALRFVHLQVNLVNDSVKFETEDYNWTKSQADLFFTKTE